MPYHVVTDGDKFCVKNADTDARVDSGCYDSEDEAKKRADAMNAAVEDEKHNKMLWLPTQEEAKYTPLSPYSDEACANCRFFSAEHYMMDGTTRTNYCHLIDNWPESILPTGYCERHETVPTLAPAVPLVDTEPMEEVVEDATEKASSSVVSRVAQTLNGLFKRADEPNFSAFKIFGNHWFARWSNNFVDKDNEFFTEKAHDDFITRVKSGVVPYPELWVEHISGTRIGQASFVGRIGHFVVAAGTFDDTVLGRKAKAYYARHKPKGVSHGFAYDTRFKEGNVYHQYNSFEFSPLNRKLPANAWTTFDGVKAMKVTPEDIAQLEEVFGKEVVQQEILANTEKASKALENIGIAYKDFAHTEDVPVAKEATARVEENLKTFIRSLIEDSAAVADYAAAAMKAQKAHETATQQAFDAYKTATDAKLATQDKQLAEMREQLNLRPRSASKDAATEVDDEKLGDEFKKQFVQKHPFWGTDVAEVGD